MPKAVNRKEIKYIKYQIQTSDNIRNTKRTRLFLHKKDHPISNDYVLFKSVVAKPLLGLVLFVTEATPAPNQGLVQFWKMA